jgi:hypothetical protein
MKWVSHYNLKINSNSAVVYPVFDSDQSTKFKNNERRRLNFKGAKTYTGTVTESTAKRIKKVVDILIQISPSRLKYNPVLQCMVRHSLSFITLTIPSKSRMIKAGEGYRELLQLFIKAMQRLGYMKHYVFKYEFQQRKQGHWHITTQDLIPHYTVRTVWNNICKMRGLYDVPNGYGEDWEAPSTETKAVKDITNMKAYLVKYLCKNEQNEESAEGRVWGCSDSLKCAKAFTVIVDSDNDKIIHRAVSLSEVECKNEDLYTVYYANGWKGTAFLTTHQLFQYREWMNNILNT